VNFPDTSTAPTRNIPGICTVDVIAVRQVASVPGAYNGFVATDVVLNGGQSFTRIRLGSAKGGHFSEKEELVKGGLFSRSLLTGALERDQVDLLAPLLAAKKDRHILVLTTHNGDQLLMGTKDEGCQLVITERTVGDDGTPFNGYQLRATLARLEPVPFYLGTAPEDVVSPDCPTWQQQLVGIGGATIWAFISEAQQDAIASIVLSGDGADIWAALSPTQQAEVLVAAGVVTVTRINNSGPPYTDIIIDPTS